MGGAHLRALVDGARERERLQARQVAVMVATQMAEKTDVALGSPWDSHADPRAHLQAAEQYVNDVDALLGEERDLRERAELEADEEWRKTHADPLAAPVVGFLADEGDG